KDSTARLVLRLALAQVGCGGLDRIHHAAHVAEALDVALTQEECHGRENNHQMQKAALNIGLIGMGTVGTNVADRLLNRRDALRRRAGVELLLKRALVRDVDRPRGIEVPAGVLTADPSALLDSSEIDVVVEVAGGEEPA